MDFIISFFRDTLDGPLYIVVVIICVILICSCIGYLAEQSLNKKKQEQEYDATHATVMNNTNQTLTQPNNSLENVAPISTQQIVNQAPQQIEQPQMQNTYVGVTNNMEQPINMPIYPQPQMNTIENITQQANSIPPTQQQPTINIDPQMISQAMGTVPPQPNIANTIPDVNNQINNQ